MAQAKDKDFWGTKRPPKPNGCIVCNKPIEVHVMVQISKKDERRRSGTTKTRGSSYCENHGIQIFKQMIKELGRA